jgi:hypothetical protein
MRFARAAVFLAAVSLVAAIAVSGDETTDRPVPRGLPGPALAEDPGWLDRARPLGRRAPSWARRMYRQSLLVLRAATDPRTGAVVAGAPPGWAYVWPRDAGTVAVALAEAGYRREARHIARFLLRLDLDAAARFYADGEPVEGRAAQGDAAGWAAVAAGAAGLSRRPGVLARGARPDPRASPGDPRPHQWHGRADYQEKDPGDYLGNAIAGGESASRIRGAFARGGLLVREAGDESSGLDTAAAWAVRPFPRPALFPLIRRTLLALAERSGRFGLLPSENWEGGEDPWTAPTAWTAWSLAALARWDRRRGRPAPARRERRAALRLVATLRRAATARGLLPERIDAETGAPRSTTPLAWSHAFAVLALRELWPEWRRPRDPPVVRHP